MSAPIKPVAPPKAAESSSDSSSSESESPAARPKAAPKAAAGAGPKVVVPQSSSSSSSPDVSAEEEVCRKSGVPSTPWPDTFLWEPLMRPPMCGEWCKYRIMELDLATTRPRLSDYKVAHVVDFDLQTGCASLEDQVGRKDFVELDKMLQVAI